MEESAAGKETRIKKIEADAKTRLSRFNFIKHSHRPLDKLLREIMMEVHKKHNVILTAIGVYSFNTTDDEARLVEEKVRKIVFDHEHVNQIHGFYLIKDTKTIRFDLVVSLDAKNRSEIFNKAINAVKKEFPDYELQAVMDTDFTEE